MYIEPPRGRTVEELYLWALELCEKLNRELDTQKEKETDNGIQVQRVRRK